MGNIIGDELWTADGHPVKVVGLHREEGILFAEVVYTDGHQPGPVGGRVGGTEQEPTWERRVLDGLVLKAGGDYYSNDDWVVEPGLRSYGPTDRRTPKPEQSIGYVAVLQNADMDVLGAIGIPSADKAEAELYAEDYADRLAEALQADIINEVYRLEDEDSLMYDDTTS